MPSNGLMVAGGIGQGLQAGVETYLKARGQNIKEQQENAQMGLMQRRLDQEQEQQKIERERQSQQFGQTLDLHNRQLQEEQSWHVLEDANKKAQIKQTGLLRGDAAKEKLDTHVSRLAGELQKDLDPDAARTGNFGQISNTFLQSQNLKRLATKSDGSIGNLTGAEQEELAIGLARLLSRSGVSSDSRINALVPKSFEGDLQGAKEWLLNEPTGRGQQEFTKRMLGTINREADLAQEQMADIQKRRLGRHQELKNKSLKTYQDILSKYGLDESGEKPGLLKADSVPESDPLEGQTGKIKSTGEPVIRKGGKWVKIQK